MVATVLAMTDDAAIVALYVGGDSLQKIARDTGLGYYAVREAVLSTGSMRTRAESNTKTGRTHKWCPRCKQSKSIGDFGRRTNPSGSMGLHGYCKVCNTDAMREWLYSITTKEYNALVEEQNGLCAMCKRPPMRSGRGTFVLQIDHNHKTQARRALLCGNCNTGLGLFGDSIERLEQAIAYLRKYGGQ